MLEISTELQTHDRPDRIPSFNLSFSTHKWHWTLYLPSCESRNSYLRDISYLREVLARISLIGSLGVSMMGFEVWKVFTGTLNHLEMI